MTPITIRFWVDEDAPEPVDVDAAIAALAARVATEKYHGAALLTEEEIVKTAEGIKYRAYHDTVRGFVTDLQEQIAAGDITDADGAREYLEQSIDGCHDVIYTHAAIEVCRQSSNDGAYFDDFGTEGAVTDGGIEWSKLAYCALLADVMEELGDFEELFPKCSECDEQLTEAATIARGTCDDCHEAATEGDGGHDAPA